MTRFLMPLQNIKNLISFHISHPFPTQAIWPVHRRAAVLVLLFIGDRGELRVLLTKRSRGLTSFSGHVSLPGGKADSHSESFEVIARREAQEEIGLPQHDDVLLTDYGLKIDTVTRELPHYLSRTFLSVKPVVYFLYNASYDVEEKYSKTLSIEKSFMKLNPGETSSVFSIPLQDLVLHEFHSDIPEREYVELIERKHRWGDTIWPVKHYLYPVLNSGEVDWLRQVEDLSSDDEIEAGQVPCKDVWGLTAKILYDIAQIAEGKVISGCPSFMVGHEDLIYGLYEFGGQLRGCQRSTWESGMIEGGRKLKCRDILPEAYMQKLKLCMSKY